MLEKKRIDHSSMDQSFLFPEIWYIVLQYVRELDATTTRAHLRCVCYQWREWDKEFIAPDWTREHPDVENIKKDVL